MLLRDLPEDILAIVLRRCVATTSNTASGLNCSLSLLAVCRMWRRIAIPLVYSRVFVRHGEPPKPGPGPFARTPNVEEPVDAGVMTNLDLIATAGCARAVKQVQIDVHCVADPLPGLLEVIKRMGAVANKWRVAELTIMVYPVMLNFVVRDVDMAKHTDDIAGAGDALAALMPDVLRLDCRAIIDSPLTRSLYGRLASRYANQLRWLHCQYPITTPSGCQFARLKKVDIGYNNMTDYRLPQMTSGDLVDMRLANGPANHSWASFSTDSDSRAIVFTKLKRLYAGYGAAYQEDGIAVRHRDGHPWRLHFPSLQSLDIFCWQGRCPLLEYAVLPPRMESISFFMKSATYLDHADLVLPATKALYLSIAEQPAGDPNGLPVINRILDNARGSKILALSITGDKLHVAPESIACTALTHLSISPPTGVDTMFEFIKRLPNLVGLTVNNLDLSGTRADLSVPGADEDVAVEPLRTSLETLAVGYDRRIHSPDKAVAAVKFLLLRIPTLTELLALQFPKGPVLNFVEAYAPRHLHLTGVKLTIVEG